MSQTTTFEPGQRVRSKAAPTHCGSEFADIHGVFQGPAGTNAGWFVIHADDGQRLQFHGDDLTADSGAEVTVSIRGVKHRLPTKGAAALMVMEFGEAARDIDITAPKSQFNIYWDEVDRLLSS